MSQYFMVLALFPVIVAVTFVPFPQIFPPNDLTLFVHLMLVYRLVEIKKKIAYLTVFHIYLHSVLDDFPGSQGKVRGEKEEDSIPDHRARNT